MNILISLKEAISKKSIYFFIGGAARSGTTLLQAILCSDKTTNPLISEAAPFRFILETYDKNKRLYEKFPGMYFDNIDELNNFYSQLLQLFLEYLRNKYSCKNLVLKEPQLTKYFPLISILLDNAKFLCMIRDPRATIASMIIWGEKMRLRGEKHFFQNRNMDELTYFYKSFYTPLFKYEKEEPSFKKRILYIKYEDLVLNPQETISKIKQFTGLSLSEFDPKKEWKKTKIDFQDKNLPICDAITELYGKPISTSRISVFKDILKKEEISVIEKKCALFFRRFGYDSKVF
ncbi:MAG: hypothetical protein MW689_000412 [Thermodesulfobacteria bacterium]|nr:sulfotransferase [Thermodesulfobacteriota bacterium]MCU4138623.1 hypothetical protein [Thermodesulfobacteriota bacterium]